MDPVARFAEYAAAFESVVASDDWASLERYFTEDAVYDVHGGPPFGGRHVGRDAVLAYLKESLDGFDRRFATRELEILDGPELRGDSVWLRWRASYSSPGLPTLVLDGEESASFDGERIRQLIDHIALEMSSLTEHWFTKYGAELAAAG